jgi:hypothetical protein
VGTSLSGRRGRRSLLSTLVIAAMLASGAALVGIAPASAALAAPVLGNPDPGASITANPIFSWSSVSGAGGYRFELSSSTSFADPLVDQQTVATRFTPTEQLPNGTLYWRVATVDSDGSVGSFGSYRQLDNTWSPPTLVSPTSGTTLSFPSQSAVFTWNPVSGAQSYTLEVSSSSTFGAGTDEYTTPNTTYSLTEPATAGTTVWWRVRATSGSDAVSGWSTPRSFTYAWDSTPSLDAPADGDTVVDTHFSWEPVAGAKTYQIQISPNGDWTNNVTKDVTTFATAYSPSAPLLNGSYYWRVRAFDAAGHAGTWSVTRSVTRQWDDAPSVVTPAAADASDPTVVGRVDFEWTASSRASFYDLEVFDGSQVLHCYTNHTRWTPYDDRSDPATTPPNGLQPGGCDLAGYDWTPGVTYRWRVRGWDRDQLEENPGKGFGVWSNGGDYQAFRFDPTIPTITAPSDGGTVETPNLQWTAVPTADHYVVTVVDNNGNVTDNAVATYANSYSPTGLDPAAGPYTWSVQSVDHDGLTSSVQERTFSLTDPASPSGSITLTAPAQGSSSLRMPMMTWSPVTGATSYTLRYWKTADGAGTASVVTTPFTSYTPTDLSPSSTGYSWRVQAFDVDGASLGASTTRNFTIGSPSLVVPDTDYLGPDKCLNPASCPTIPDTPTLQWAPVSNATHYLVTIANDSNFTNRVSSYLTEYTTLTPRESLKDSQAGKAYYWYVQACTYNGCGPDSGSSARSNASSFRKYSDPVSLNSPADDDSHSVLDDAHDQITFDWADFHTNASTGSEQEPRDYHLVVATDQNFIDGSTIDDVIVDATRYTASDRLYPDGPLYWRVQAVDNSDNKLTWSPTRTIRKVVTAPTPSYPADGATVHDVPHLSWSPTQFAAGYEVQISPNGDTNFSDPIVDAFSGDTEFSATSPLVGLPADDYAWRVRSIDADGNRGAWSSSPASTFTLSLDPPVLTAPDAGGTIRPGTAVFQWAAVPGAAKYQWQLGTSSSFSSVTAEQETQMAAWSPREQLADGTYFWRVRALDAAGNLLSSSSARSVTLSSTTPTATITTANPWTVRGPVTATFNKPVTGVDGSSFKVQVNNSTTDVPGTVNVSDSTHATWTPSAPLVPGQYYDIELSGSIQDALGNALDASTTTRRVYTAVQNGDVAFTEHWDRATSSAASGGSYDASSLAGTTTSLAFTGTRVSLVGVQTRAGGYADVYLDNRLDKSNVSFYSSTTLYQRTVWARSGLSSGAHTLKVVVKGTRYRSATGTRVLLDRFDVDGVRVEQTSPAVTQTFRRYATSAASGGSYDLAQHSTAGFSGTRAWVGATVRGTKISVVGFKSTSSGTAAIYIDNRYVANVSLHDKSTRRVTLYTSGTLSNTVHTVRVFVNGTSTGSGSNVGIDYVQAS